MLTNDHAAEAYVTRMSVSQSRGPEMVPGITPLIWLWNQPTKLHCFGKSTPPKQRGAIIPGLMPGVRTFLTPNSAQISRSC